MTIMWSLFVCFMSVLTICTGQLIVNVQDGGGDVFQESISANTTSDIVTLQFLKADGTNVTQLIDFRNELQIFRILILAEEERGEHGYQVLCFVMRFIKSDFISSDAMSKLRQKNPGAVRHPEDSRGEEQCHNDLQLHLDRSGILSPQIAPFCQGARDTTYAKEADLRYLSRSLNRDFNILMSSGVRIATGSSARCKEVSSKYSPCSCQYHLCVPWYPCGLKYCRGKDSAGKVVSYRCGIRTCQKCRLFMYYVQQKQQCLWDDLMV